METNTSALSGLEPLLSIEDLSEYLNVPVRTLYDWRLAGKAEDVKAVETVEF